MSDRANETPLSTADMVSAANRQPTATPSQPPAAREGGAVAQKDRGDGSGAAGTDGASGTAPRPGAATATPEAGKAAPLLASDAAEGYHSRWEQIQAGFVDEPRRAVEQADQLVAEVIKRIAEVFAEERNKLESQWSRGDKVDTEALRVALTRYRSFFERLLSA